MIIGVPTEVLNNEYRVALTPTGVHELSTHGHRVLIQAGAGEGSSFSDEEYLQAGAELVADAASVWATAEMILKVKEPQREEFSLLRKDQILFTYLHLAASRSCTDALLNARTTGIAYETVQLADRSLPLLAPMSELAGRLAVQIGSNLLLKPSGGRGVLLSGVPGTPKAHIVVIGGGAAGENAARIGLGLEADVTVFDISVPRLRELDFRYKGQINTLRSSPYDIAEALKTADLVIGSVLIPGAAAPKLVTNAMVKEMKAGSVLIDIAIDQGGCFEDSHPTSHQDPTFTVYNSTFYCVSNMPGAVPNTSTRALTNATMPYIIKIANLGLDAALQSDPALQLGLNTYQGSVANASVADALGIEYVPYS
ncbi:MAG: alanine dehydrogenase [Microbacteriaceae bacterium]